MNPDMDIPLLVFAGRHAMIKLTGIRKGPNRSPAPYPLTSETATRS
jgi:hypothetical protein